MYLAVRSARQGAPVLICPALTEKTGMYHFPGESKVKGEKIARNTAEMIGYYRELIERFPIISIEDGLDEEDWDGWQAMTEQLGERIQLVGDDLFVTNTKRLDAGIKLQSAPAQRRRPVNPAQIRPHLPQQWKVLLFHRFFSDYGKLLHTSEALPGSFWLPQA